MPQRKSLSKMHSFLTPSFIIGATALIACIATVGVFFYVRQVPGDVSVAVTRGPIISEVDATGVVKPVESVDLGFELGGTIRTVLVKVGDHVAAGEELATLDGSTLAAGREQAEANLAVAQAKLSALQSGTRPEEVASGRAATAAAITAGYIAADDAIHGKADQFFYNPHTMQPTLTITLSDSQLSGQLTAQRVEMEAMLVGWQADQPAANAASSTDLVAQAEAARQDLLTTETFLNMTAQALTEAIPSQSVPAGVISGYQASITAARAEVSGALAALNAAAGQLSVEEAGATLQDIATAQAGVLVAQVAVHATDVTLAETVIRAPIGGVITRQDGNAGEVVAPGQSFISLDSGARFEIDAQVSEADIAKITVGEPVTVTLDAYSGETFTAAIVTVDPAATVQNGVASYKITAQFTKDDPRIKAGLTANLSINAGRADDALLIPASALITKGTALYVLRADAAGATTLVPVTVGLKSANEVQILSGLTAGDRVTAFGSTAQ